MFFVSEGNVIRINELLEGGVLMDFCDYDRRMVFYLVVIEGYLYVVELMLKCGVNINLVDWWGDIVNFFLFCLLDVFF